MDTTASTPCLECGTTAGLIPRDCANPRRRRGLCDRCYDRHRTAGTLADYALTPQGRLQGSKHPAALPGYIKLVAPRYLVPWGGPATAAWQKAVAYEARRAAEWLRARQAVA